MIEEYKNNLNELSKDQLIYLIEKFYDSYHRIGNICVEESKMHISMEKAIEEIRKSLYPIPSLYDINFLKTYIDMEMGKISVEEYLRNIGLE